MFLPISGENIVSHKQNIVNYSLSTL